MTITNRILLQIAIAAGLVILIATAVTYRMVYHAAEDEALDHLHDYVSERSRIEEAGFSRIEENLELARNQFLHRLAAPPPADLQQQWDKWFEKFPDGAWRSRREFADGRKWSTLWMQKGVVLTPEVQAQIVHATDICNDLLPTWVDSFESLYFVFPFGANIGFDPRIPNWVWDTPADYDNNAIEAIVSSNPQNNPSRAIVWNSVLEEPTSHNPYITVMLPIDVEGRNVASVGHDIHALRLLDEATRSRLPGVTHFIFRRDGRLIAHREKMKEILASNGHLTMEESGEPGLQSLYRAALTKDVRLFSSFDPVSGCYFAVARLAGPDWLFMSTVPQAYLRQMAFGSAQWVLWSGLVSLGLVLGIFALILRRQVARPLAELARATGEMGSGNLTARAAVSGGDELGRLASAFNEMVSKVAARGAELTTLNQTLESRVAERTHELRESEERFSKAFKASPALSALTRLADGCFVSANEAFYKISGYTEAEIIGRTALELQIYAQPEQRDEYVDLIRRRGAVRDQELILQTKSGALRTILSSGECFDLNGEPHLLTVGLDITDRKEIESEIMRALEREKELSELKGRFVSMVSHEFRTPLGVIQSSADVLDRYLDRLTPEERRDYLAMIFRATRGLANLIESVLLLGRVEDGRMQFVPAPLDFVRLCGECVNEVQSATKARCPIEMTVTPGLEGARSDADLLRHVLTNLLNNAVKYSEPDSPVLLALARSGNEAIVTIRDRGIGIPDEDRAHLFTSFARGSNVGQRPGSGLGLLIVQRCVALHGGTIQVESTVGAGTKVTVTLPLFVLPTFTPTHTLTPRLPKSESGRSE